MGRPGDLRTSAKSGRMEFTHGHRTDRTRAGCCAVTASGVLRISRFHKEPRRPTTIQRIEEPELQSAPGPLAVDLPEPVICVERHEMEAEISIEYLMDRLPSE